MLAAGPKTHHAIHNATAGQLGVSFPLQDAVLLPSYSWINIKLEPCWFEVKLNWGVLQWIQPGVINNTSLQRHKANFPQTFNTTVATGKYRSQAANTCEWLSSCRCCGQQRSEALCLLYAVIFTPPGFTQNKFRLCRRAKWKWTLFPEEKPDTCFLYFHSAVTFRGTAVSHRALSW